MSENDELGRTAAVYCEATDYVTVDMKRLTAERVVTWLEDAAQTYEIGGADKSAEHARAVAKRLENELENDE